MHKLITTCLLLLSASLLAVAQTAVTADEQERIIAEINAAAKDVRTIQCDFTQTKTLSIMNDRLVSRGNMVYAQPGHLRWAYTTPYTYTFVITDDKVHIAKGSQRSSIDLRSSQAFQELARLMAGSVTGQCLASGRDYDVTILADAHTYVAQLRPKDKRLRQLFATIRLTFDRQTRIVREVLLTEPAGDTTTITLNNVRQNQPVNAKAFSLD